MIRRIAGVFLLLLAAVLLGWLGYILFIKRLPEARGKASFPAFIFAVALIYVGSNWVRGKTAK